MNRQFTLKFVNSAWMQKGLVLIYVNNGFEFTIDN